ncbi:hypothetical protein [Streptomyces sp. NBC_00572]|uniref:hypothetical protein n=1 Tax=Streptomyces sp. NBC_00572 TaxID=2903664 RepID=UPI002252951A|nr:hypothetical protein [Streptomyces sp. NBC_00572]MCX4986478.1 hypothetical protein [Streptomyces sp. NBC_00572]
MSEAIHGSTTSPGTGHPPASARRSARPLTGVGRTVALVLYVWAAAAVVSGVSFLVPSAEWVAISAGVVLCLLFGGLLHLLHRGIWLVLLAAVPALFVLVGAVQYAPELALERYGVRDSVVVAADSAAGTGSKNHELTLRGSDGRELAEKLGYRGNGAPDVGERLDIVRDARGKVPMEQADQVDAAGRLEELIGGLVVWTLLVLMAGWRGHVARRRDLELYVGARS